jgi:hypothetical protein
VHASVLSPSSSTSSFFTKFYVTRENHTLLDLSKFRCVRQRGYYVHIKNIYMLHMEFNIYSEMRVLFHFPLAGSYRSYLSPLLPSPASISLTITKRDTLLQQIRLVVLASFWLGQCPTMPSGSCLFPNLHTKYILLQYCVVS